MSQEVYCYLFELTIPKSKERAKDAIIWHPLILIFNRLFSYTENGIKVFKADTLYDVHTHGILRYTPRLGRVSITKKEFKNYIIKLGKNRFTASKHDYFSNNSKDFATKVAKFLNVDNIPDYDRLPKKRSVKLFFNDKFCQPCS